MWFLDQLGIYSFNFIINLIFCGVFALFYWFNETGWLFKWSITTEVMKLLPWTQVAFVYVWEIYLVIEAIKNGFSISLEGIPHIQISKVLKNIVGLTTELDIKTTRFSFEFFYKPRRSYDALSPCSSTRQLCSLPYHL